MRFSPALVAPWTTALSARLPQTVGQAGGHRSGSTDRPVAAATAVQGHVTLRRVSPHTFDIRV